MGKRGRALDSEPFFLFCITMDIVMCTGETSLHSCISTANGVAERGSDWTRRCWCEIFRLTVTYQFRAGSGYWPIIGYLVVLG